MESDNIDIRDFYFHSDRMAAFDGTFGNHVEVPPTPPPPPSPPAPSLPPLLPVAALPTDADGAKVSSSSSLHQRPASTMVAAAAAVGGEKKAAVQMRLDMHDGEDVPLPGSEAEVHFTRAFLRDIASALSVEPSRLVIQAITAAGGSSSSLIVVNFDILPAGSNPPTTTAATTAVVVGGVSSSSVVDGVSVVDAVWSLSRQSRDRNSQLLRGAVTCMIHASNSLAVRMYRIWCRILPPPPTPPEGGRGDAPTSPPPTQRLWVLNTPPTTTRRRRTTRCGGGWWRKKAWWVYPALPPGQL
jgi:hypothetical protein